MLLNSSQVSLLVTAGVISISTFFLFIAGVYLQHQTVNTIRKTIIEPQQARWNPTRPKNLFYDEDEGDYLHHREFPARDPLRTVAAHVQIVRDESLLCNSLMILSSLWSGTKGRISIDRVLLFPSSWNTTASSRTIRPTTRRLLQAAENRFDIHLQPMSDLPDLTMNDKTAPFLREKLSGYSAALYLSSALALVNPRPYDALLSATPPSREHPFVDESLLLVAPDPKISQAVANKQSDGLTRHMQDQEDEFSEEEEQALSTAFRKILNNAPNSLLHLPRKGPQYDVPVPELDDRGKRLDPDMRAFVRRTWANFRDKREEVCGLDLEPWIS